MNQTNEFCQTTAKFIPPFHLFFLILLHLLSSFILKLSVLMPIKSQNQVKNQAMKSKAKIMLDEFVY